MQGHVARLIGTSDLGQTLKPFVFLGLFDNQGRHVPDIGLHPHSGLATLTYVAEGSVSYEDTNGAVGVLPAGGVEWMRAGRGAWHAAGAGTTGRIRGFQMWVALPPHLELGKSESLYQSAADIPRAGPASVLLGSYDGASSAIEAPSPINYLAVNLKAGEAWRYEPPAGHTILWVGMNEGVVDASHEALDRGEIVVFAAGEEAVTFKARTDSEFVVGSAAQHPHDLVVGRYSIHTSAEALQIGEAQIEAIRDSLVAAGRL
jgi:redox-sensitive bicupin YhaK (pirin superfamily)